MSGGKLREFVYVSEGKLKQFLPNPRRFVRPKTVRLTTPVGGVDVEAPTADNQRDRQLHLKQVDKHVGERARWFAEPGLQAGQWVWFEAPLRCVTLRGDYQYMVLFLDPAPGQEPEHERETGCRLLLHGSSRHLVGYTPATVDGPTLEGIDGGGSSMGTVFLTTAGQVVTALSLGHDPVAEGAPMPVTDLNGNGVQELIQAIDARPAPPGSAARMCGHARVTADLPATDCTARCVVASPLTVEYAYDLA
jgi:hypothetical protein